MTDTYGPMDGFPWADQTQWYRHAPKWASSGVNGSPASASSSGDLALSLSALNFTIGTGRAWAQGVGFERSGSPASQAIAANTNASLSRRDRVVLRRDLAAKTVAPVLIQGTPAATPAAPALQRVDTGQWDLPLFSFLTPPNSGTTITGIIDERAWVDSTSGKGLSVYAASGRTAMQDVAADGLRVYESSTKRDYRWDAAATAWQYAGGAPPPIVAATVGSGYTPGASFAPGCYKDASGLVCVVGGVTNGGPYTPSGNVMFNLPSGFWPTRDIAVPVMNATGWAIGGVYAADGAVKINVGPALGSATLHTVNFSFHPGFAGGALA